MTDIEFQVLISMLLEKEDLIPSERNVWQQPYAIIWRFTKLLIILKLGVFSND